MEKTHVFLDSSVVISYLQGNEGLENLFSKRMLKKVRYMISSNVYQEVILAANRMEMTHRKNSRKEFARFESLVELIPDNAPIMGLDGKWLLKFMNLKIPYDDVLILRLRTALSNCDYFVTLDEKLLKIGCVDGLKIFSPLGYFSVMEGCARYLVSNLRW